MSPLFLGRIVAPVVLFFAAASLAAAETPSESKPAKHPNVLFIVLDDLNHWVGHLHRNNQTITPNIDRLAARGMTFTHGYCAAPVCNPSRAAVMSGMRPGTTGIYDNGPDWRKAIGPERTLVTAFRNAGYYTAGAGKIYHGKMNRPTEWDDFQPHLGPDQHPAQPDGVGDIVFAPIDCEDSAMNDFKVVDYGIEQLNKPHDKPLLLTIGIHKPHLPWYVPRKYFDMHPLEKIELPPVTKNDLDDVPPIGRQFAKSDRDHRQILESGRWKEAVQGYLATVSFADAMVGRLLDGLEKSGQADNTIVVLWGDHGWHFGEKEHWRKSALWEETTRAPFIWVVPGLTKPDTRCTTPVDFMSIYPTLTDLCDIPTPKHVEGKSLRPLLTDPAAPWPQGGITTYLQSNHSVRFGDWRYTRYADGGEELYDHAQDPYEWTNLAEKSEHADKKAELAKLLPTVNHPRADGKAERDAFRTKRAAKKAAGK
ncbi:MAG: sulfatase [Planctomycetota bacterium]|nr:sulfatase [Planctomycetota bacterium]